MYEKKTPKIPWRGNGLTGVSCAIGCGVASSDENKGSASSSIVDMIAVAAPFLVNIVRLPRSLANSSIMLTIC